MESLVFLGVLLAITVTAFIQYFRKLCKVREEYGKAKEVVDDVILSFNRQLKREAEKIELVSYKVGALSSQSDKAFERVKGLERQWHNIEPKIGAMFEEEQKIVTRLSAIDKKACDVVASQEKLESKIYSIEEQTKQFSIIPEPKVEAAIPIRREKAFAPLTETELSVLRLLTFEEAKTAPEVRASIGLSREHTARLMKKLYEEGYLERDTTRIPFRYLVTKEMERLLKKTESEA